MSETVCGVVVTHNRRELLRECLQAVTGQTRRPDAILVVDNASTDGSPDLVRAEFPSADLLELPTNEGSSGGFHEGMKTAAARGFDWLWVMDDDTIPRPDALEILLDARANLDGDPYVLASKVLWTDGSLHPMNWPGLATDDFDAFVRGIERSVLRIRSNTFPSLLVKREAIEKYGPPRKGFFIWADDIDFTQRILRHESGYMIPRSVAVHKTKTPHKPWEGGERFYYAVRNGIFILRGDSLSAKEKVGWVLLVGAQIQRFLAAESLKPSSLKVVLRGLRDGIFKPRPTL